MSKLGIQQIKCVVVGDAAVGKTSMIIRFKSHTDNPTDGSMFNPTVECEVVKQLLIEMNEKKVPINLHIFDTAGQEDFDRIRPLAYPQTDIFLVCFSICSRASFVNITYKWVPELTHQCPNVPFFLIGCKDDLRKKRRSLVRGWLRESEMIQNIPGGIIKIIEEHLHWSTDFISDEEALELSKKIGAVTYMSCTAATEPIKGNINDIFIQAAKHCVNSRGAAETSCCNLL